MFGEQMMNNQSYSKEQLLFWVNKKVVNNETSGAEYSI